MATRIFSSSSPKTETTVLYDQFKRDDKDDIVIFAREAPLPNSSHSGICIDGDGDMSYFMSGGDVWVLHRDGWAEPAQ